MARREEPREEEEGPLELLIFGDLTDKTGRPSRNSSWPCAPARSASSISTPLGGSAYSAVSLTSLMRLRGVQALGVVAGECSSAALWPLAACQRRLVTPHSVLLFHPMKWQSEEHVLLAEAAEWARHFADLEGEMDRLLAQLFGVELDVIAPWLRPGRYVSGPELAEAGTRRTRSARTARRAQGRRKRKAARTPRIRSASLIALDL